MAQLIIPTDRKIKGPWLIDPTFLESLDQTISIIDSKLEEAFNTSLELEAKEYFEEYKNVINELDLEKSKTKVGEFYRFKKSEKLVVITDKNGDKIRDESLVQLLKDRKLEHFEPTELHLQITKGPCEFMLEISTKYFGDLKTRTKVPDDILFEDINYELNKWIEKNRPNMAMQTWSSWFPFAAFPILFLLFILTPFLFKSTSDIYKQNLKQQSHAILKDGLTDQEIKQAIQILLENQSNYVPNDFATTVRTNRTLLFTWGTMLITVLILLIKPRTVIGLGRNKWKVSFYRKWTYFVLVFIPVSFVFPILRSKFF